MPKVMPENDDLIEQPQEQENCLLCRKAAELARIEWEQGGSPASLPTKCPHGDERKE